MNKSIWKAALEVIMYLVTFLLIDFLVQAVVGAAYFIIKYGTVGGKALDAMLESPEVSVASSVISAIIVMLVFVKAKWIPMSRNYIATRPWDAFVWILLLTIGIQIPLASVYEVVGMPDMPEDFQKTMEGIVYHPLGYICIAVLPPLVEETVCRGAILRKLLTLFGPRQYWLAIAVSAAIFGVIHGNVAQGVNAFILGMLLGWMYYRTHSIVPGMVLHWIHNSLAYFLLIYCPQYSDAQVSDLFGGNTLWVVLAVVFSLCIAVPSLYQLSFRLKEPVEKS